MSVVYPSIAAGGANALGTNKSRSIGLWPLFLFALLLMVCSSSSHAQATTTTTFDLPVVTSIGCALVEWMTGPLAVVVFLIVVIGTLVIGIFAKMDWTKILTVVVIFGIIQGLVAGSFKLGVANKPTVCTNIQMLQ